MHSGSMKRNVSLATACMAFLCMLSPVSAQLVLDRRSYWRPYEKRYGIVIMAGNVEGREPHYGWYWADTHGMYLQLLRHAGFSRENTFFLSYGKKARKHEQEVHAKSTTENIRKLLYRVSKLAGHDDLVYMYWIDHGNPRGFETYDGFLSHGEVGELIRAIRCRMFIGAFNPCNSGAVIDDVRSRQAIICTSTSPEEANAWGWAGQWREALQCGQVKPISDLNGDGQVSIAEAYAWVATRANKAGEHPLIDDNGDGKPGKLGALTYDPADANKDGFIAARHSLGGWMDHVPDCWTWIPAVLDGQPGSREDPRREFAAFLRKQKFISKYAKKVDSRPVVLFCHADVSEGKDSPAPSAHRCRRAFQEVFCFPAASRTPFAGQFVQAFSVDVSSLSMAVSPLVHNRCVPVVLVLQANGELASILKGSRLTDALVFDEIRQLLSEEKRTAVDARVKHAVAVLRDLRTIEKRLTNGRDHYQKTLRELARKETAKSRTDLVKQVQVLEALTALFAQSMETLRELLARPMQ